MTLGAGLNWFENLWSKMGLKTSKKSGLVSDKRGLGRCWVFLTEHKSGTVWQKKMSRVFADQIGASATWVSYRDTPSIEPSPGHDYIVFFERSVLFLGSAWSQHPHLRGIRMVRDPRDVIISGMDYHSRGSEEWLRKPQEKFNGRSYVEELCSIESRVDRLRFEMRNRGMVTIKEMARPVDHRFINIRYEDLFSWERAPGVLSEISQWLGLDREEFTALEHAYSLTHIENQRFKPSHATRGIKTRWRDEWPPELNDEFADLFAEQSSQLPYQLPVSRSSDSENAPLEK